MSDHMGRSATSLVTYEIVEKACAATWGDHWPNVPNAEGQREYMRRSLKAVEHDLIDTDPIPDLASGETFRAIQAAIEDPGAYCTQLTSYPPPLRQMEPVSRWQTRAVMCALGRLMAPPEAPVGASGQHTPRGRSGA